MKILVGAEGVTGNFPTKIEGNNDGTPLNQVNLTEKDKESIATAILNLQSWLRDKRRDRLTSHEGIKIMEPEIVIEKGSFQAPGKLLGSDEKLSWLAEKPFSYLFDKTKTKIARERFTEKPSRKRSSLQGPSWNEFAESRDPSRGELGDLVDDERGFGSR